MDTTIIGWLLTAVFGPVAGTLWAAWQRALKRIDTLQDARIEDEKRHGAETREAEKRHGENRLEDANQYAEALEAQIQTLERAVESIADQHSNGLLLAENTQMLKDHTAALETCHATMQVIKQEQEHIKLLIQTSGKA